MFKLSTPFFIIRYGSPIIIKDMEMPIPGIDHGFDGKCHAFAQAEPMSSASEMGNLNILMEEQILKSY